MIERILIGKDVAHWGIFALFMGDRFNAVKNLYHFGRYKGDIGLCLQAQGYGGAADRVFSWVVIA